jgi:predicted 3-demethylubiquinone-9 3-methyltransferase (glyoxalase superfamily)
MQKITPFLWFDKEAGEAAKFYTTVFSAAGGSASGGKTSRIKETQTIPNTPSGTIEIVTIELMGQEFTLMSAGPLFKFNESVSFVVNCETQEEVDYYWEKLISGGGQESMCGWLKDKYGLSWQIVPTSSVAMLRDKDRQKANRVMQALLQMKKIDIAKLQQAYNQR